MHEHYHVELACGHGGTVTSQVKPVAGATYYCSIDGAPSKVTYVTPAKINERFSPGVVLEKQPDPVKMAGGTV